MEQDKILYDISPILGFYSPSDLIKIFESLNNKITQLNKYSSSDFLSLTSELKQYRKQAGEIKDHVAVVGNVVKELFSENPTSLIQIDFVVDKTNCFFNVIGELITDLQFHDIIRQKLENIQRINTNTIEELQMVNQIDDKSIFVNRTEYVQIIPDLALLEYKQFELTNSEFVEAILSLKNTLTELEIDTVSIVTILNELYEKYKDIITNEELINLFHQITSLGNEIVIKIGDSIEQMKHSEPFSVVIKELKIILTQINSKIKINKDDNRYIINADKLAKITKLFTVASEHNVHKRLFVTTQSLSATELLTDESASVEEEDDELELF